MKELNNQELIDIIYDCTVLGTGGGGSLENGLKIIEEDIRQGRKFYLESLDNIPDDAYVACPYGCGAISPETEEQHEM